MLYTAFMGNDTENHTLELLRGLREEMADGFRKVQARIGDINNNVGHLASAMVTLRREVREVIDTVQPMAVASTHYAERLGRIERHLGIDDPAIDR